MPLRLITPRWKSLNCSTRAPALDALGERGVADDPIGDAEQGQRQVEDHAEDEADGQVVGEERGDHADREHRQADEPVADVGADEQADVGRPEAPAEHEVNANIENNSDTV